MGLLARLCSLRGMVRGLREEDLPGDPLVLFDQWFRFARRVRVYWPDSAALATADAAGNPSVRMVLLKGYRTDGFMFYTNYESRKGRDLADNPKASMVLYWNDLLRQVRVTGPVEKLSREESERYFHSRLRGSQIGAWASRQDQPVESRRALMAMYEEFDRKFAGGTVPLPPHWGGYRIIPEAIEFWQARTYRLHDRFLYRRKEDAWGVERLCP